MIISDDKMAKIREMQKTAHLHQLVDNFVKTAQRQPKQVNVAPEGKHKSVNSPQFGNTYRAKDSTKSYSDSTLDKPGDYESKSYDAAKGHAVGDLKNDRMSDIQEVQMRLKALNAVLGPAQKAQMEGRRSQMDAQRFTQQSQTAFLNVEDYLAEIAGKYNDGFGDAAKQLHQEVQMWRKKSAPISTLSKWVAEVHNRMSKMMDSKDFSSLSTQPQVTDADGNQVRNFGDRRAPDAAVSKGIANDIGMPHMPYVDEPDGGYGAARMTPQERKQIAKPTRAPTSSPVRTPAPAAVPAAKKPWYRRMLGASAGDTGKFYKVSESEWVWKLADVDENALTGQLGSHLHDEWRKPRLQSGDHLGPDARYEPRMKGDVDIANTSYDKLPEKWQGENKSQAQSVVQSIMKRVNSGISLDSLNMEELAAEVHEQWLQRNGSWAPPEQKLPYEQLSEPEKEKDRVVVRQGLQMIQRSRQSNAAQTPQILPSQMGQTLSNTRGKLFRY